MVKTVNYMLNIFYQNKNLRKMGKAETLSQKGKWACYNCSTHRYENTRDTEIRSS